MVSNEYQRSLAALYLVGLGLMDSPKKQERMFGDGVVTAEIDLDIVGEGRQQLATAMRFELEMHKLTQSNNVTLMGELYV